MPAATNPISAYQQTCCSRAGLSWSLAIIFNLIRPARSTLQRNSEDSGLSSSLAGDIKGASQRTSPSRAALAGVSSAARSEHQSDASIASPVKWPKAPGRPCEAQSVAEQTCPPVGARHAHRHAAQFPAPRSAGRPVLVQQFFESASLVCALTVR